MRGLGKLVAVVHVFIPSALFMLVSTSGYGYMYVYIYMSVTGLIPVDVSYIWDVCSFSIFTGILV